MIRVAVVAAFILAALATSACRDDKHDHADTPRVKIDSARYRVDLYEDDVVLGGDAPLVTIVVFTDYACPPCGRTWQVMDNLVQDYGDDLRVVLRSFTVPGFERGEQAAEAAFAAGAQDKFWPMHRRLFAHPSTFDRPSLIAHAQAIGLDVERFVDDLDTGSQAGRRVRHRRQAKELGILGLPATFVNGLFVAGYHDEKVWHGIVDEEIQKAKEKIAAGVPRAKLYAEHMASATADRVHIEGAAELQEKLAAQTPPTLPQDLEPPDPAQRYDIPIDGAPSIGPEDAPVVIVEFVDFRCPYCRRAWTEVAEVLAAHPNDVRLVVKQLPLEIHPEAHGAAIAALAAHRQGKFAELHADLFAHEGELGRREIVAFSEKHGLDVPRLLTDLDDAALAQEVAADIAIAGRLGVSGTPAFFINGKYENGYRPGTIKAMVDEELARAGEQIASGTARAEVARVLMGPTAVGPEGFPNP